MLKAAVATDYPRVSEAFLNLVLHVSVLFGVSQVNPGCQLSTVNDVLLRFAIVHTGAKVPPCILQAVFRDLLKAVQESLSILQRSV